ncbi:MAG TPA: hypothetical protein VLS51_11445 [Propionibacteriaceae bacterium]|nr:hypothetical protein [Propionibacteriaceae bacterium]
MTQLHSVLDPGVVLHHRCTDARLRIRPALKDPRNPLFGEDFFASPPKPWEVRIDNGYPVVLRDPDSGLYRCYYTSFSRDPGSASVSLEERRTRHYVPLGGRRTALLYAESTDGVSWTKPALGLHLFDGSAENNILLPGAHGASVFVDEQDPDPERRYKMVTLMDEGPGNHWMGVSWSRDGIHFVPVRRWPQHSPAADTHNFAFRDPVSGRYQVVTRIWQDGIRVAAISESTDFYEWSRPRPILATGPGAQVYSMPVFRVRGQYVGLASIYHEGDRAAEDFDRVDLTLASAVHLSSWRLPAPEQVLVERGPGSYPDGAWDCGCIYASTPVTDDDGTTWVYYMGGNGRHTDFRETGLGRASVDPERMAYVEPVADRAAQLVLGPFNVDGPVRLLLESDDGSCVAALTDSHGVPSTPERPVSGTGWVEIPFSAEDIEAVSSAATYVTLTFQRSRVFAIAGDIHHIRRHES